MMCECKGTKKINSCKKKKTKNINTRKYSIDIGKNIIVTMFAVSTALCVY